MVGVGGFRANGPFSNIRTPETGTSRNVIAIGPIAARTASPEVNNESTMFAFRRKRLSAWTSVMCSSGSKAARPVRTTVPMTRSVPVLCHETLGLRMMDLIFGAWLMIRRESGIFV